MAQDNKLTISVAIIIAAILIAGALIFVKKGDDNQLPQNGQQPTGTVNAKPVSSDDHILGNPNAEIIIVEYSDLECPYCKQFHETMHRVIDEYGKDGKVAWVYRHFPLAQLHSKAAKEAEATECATELGGNTKFWEYTDRLFEITPSNNGLDLNLLPQIAEDVGLNRSDFEKCLDSGKYEEAIEDAVQEAFDAGGRGTPHNIMIVGDEQIEIPGAQPFTAIKAAIEAALE